MNTCHPVEIVKVELTSNNVHVRWACGVCGGSTEKESVEPRVVTPGPFHDIVLCRRCVAAGPSGVEGRMLARAEWHEQRAAWLRAHAGFKWQIPTMADWEAADREDEAEWERLAARDAAGQP